MRVAGLAGILLAVTLKLSYSQIDTEFWFVAPEVTSGHGDRPIVLRITTFETAARGTISQPANPDFPEINFNIPAMSSQTVDLTSQIQNIENSPAFTRLKKGLLIRSDQPITVYYEANNILNPDIFSLKGRNALGKEFLIPAQNFWSNSNVYDPKPVSGFDIVATENDTRVTIVLSKPVKGYSEGTSLQVVLNRGETYSVETLDENATNQLTGTYVRSDRFIAITLKDDSNSNSGCHDLGGDQLVPVDVLGTEYIIVKGFLSPNDKVFVMAIADNTSVIINGRNTQSKILNRGEMQAFDLLDHSLYIQSNHPVYVLHATGFGCEVGLALVPKVECTGSRSVSFTRSTDEFFGAIIITNTSYTGSFIFNGDNNVITREFFDTVPGTKGLYSAARIDLSGQPANRTAFRLENTKGSFHLGIINGENFTGCRYGYFSDFKTLKILSSVTKICFGNSIELKATGTDQFYWKGDPMIEGVETSEIEVTPDTTTLYSVIGSDASKGCLDTAEILIEVFEWPNPAVEISPSCIYHETTFNYSGDEELSYLEWIFNRRDTFRTGWKDTLELTFEEPGTKELLVRAFNPAGCMTQTEFPFETGGFDVELDSMLSVTRGMTIQLEPHMTKGNAGEASVLWTPALGLACPTCLSTEATPLTENQYTLHIRDSLGCSSVFQTLVFVNDPVFIPNAFSPNGDGINDAFRMYAKGVQLESFLVYDRWGRLMFQSTRGDSQWDGLINGRIAPPGTYVYHFSGRHLRSQTPFEYSGDVTLMR